MPLHLNVCWNHWMDPSIKSVKMLSHFVNHQKRGRKLRMPSFCYWHFDLNAFSYIHHRPWKIRMAKQFTNWSLSGPISTALNRYTFYAAEESLIGNRQYWNFVYIYTLESLEMVGCLGNATIMLGLLLLTLCIVQYYSIHSSDQPIGHVYQGVCVTKMRFLVFSFCTFPYRLHRKSNNNFHWWQNVRVICFVWYWMFDGPLVKYKRIEQELKHSIFSVVYKTEWNFIWLQITKMSSMSKLIKWLYRIRTRYLFVEYVRY